MSPTADRHDVVREREVVHERDVGPYPDEIVEDEGHSVYRRFQRGPWSLAGVFSLAAAMVFGVMGLVALARTGVTRPLSEPVVMVGWLEHNAWLALAHVGLALLLAAAGAAAARERFGVLFLSGVMMIAGLVLLIEPGAFNSRLAITEDHGITYLVTGVVLMAASLLAPTVYKDDSVITRTR